MKKYDCEEPTRMTIFPKDGDDLFRYIRTLMGWFDVVSILRTGERIQDGVLLDVYSSDPVSQAEGLTRLKYGGLTYSLDNPARMS